MSSNFFSMLKLRIHSSPLSERRSALQLLAATCLCRLGLNSKIKMTDETNAIVVKNGWVVKKKEIRS